MNGLRKFPGLRNAWDELSINLSDCLPNVSFKGCAGFGFACSPCAIV